MKKQKIFYIYNLQLKDLKRKGFYKIIWFGILAQFRIVTITKDEKKENLLSVGTKIPLEEFLKDGYKFYCAGYILGFPIIIYNKKEIK